MEIDTNAAPDLSGPVLAVGPDDMITMAYTGRDGSGFIRHLRPDGSLSTRQVNSSNLGSADAENGAIVPLIVLPESGTTVVLYRDPVPVHFLLAFQSTGNLVSATSSNRRY